MSASEINKVCFRKRRSHLLQGASVWTRVVGPRSKKENSIHIKNGRGHFKNGRRHIKNKGGSQLELDGRGRGGAGQKGDERKLVR